MSPRRTASRLTVALLGTLGAVGLLGLSPAVVVLALLAASLCGLAAYGWGQFRAGWPDESSAYIRTSSWRAAGVGLLAVLGLNGLIGLLGAATVPVLLVGAAAAITTMALRGAARDRRPPAANPGPPPPPPPEHPGRPEPDRSSAPPPQPERTSCPVPTLSTEMLCWEWRRSYVEVCRATDPAHLSRLVLLRAAYLDELERRDPEGFRKWLDSGARAAGDPARFVAGG
ncbi:hypothetical protein ACVGVM_18595 [Pseudonocardia bannensis]|uniref:Uncharacterized protein n=1 Tax=Pseudonocardia bannensis TaxID=630973 RepID=A0A848DIL6_9PSEU|nr:hypothetical protein [Pseudonocardia bannensis]NMH92294.1 hypothetical protein [Pseudonocardia bannensis]